MKKIFKYTVKNRRVMITLPEGTKIISAGNQDNVLILWAEVPVANPGEPPIATEDRFFEAFVTGDPIDCDPAYTLGNFIGTVLLKGGTTVVHVYELFLTPAAQPDPGIIS